MVLTRRSYIEIASYFFNNRKGKVFQISTNVSVARELNPGPWQHLTTIRWKSDGTAGNWTRGLPLSWRMLYHWATDPRPDTCQFRLMTPILLTLAACQQLSLLSIYGWINMYKYKYCESSVELDCKLNLNEWFWPDVVTSK